MEASLMNTTPPSPQVERPPLTPFIEELLDMVAVTCGPLSPECADALHRQLWERFYHPVEPHAQIRSADHNGLSARLLSVEMKLSATKGDPKGRWEDTNYKEKS
jgi:hypothetical protein